MEEQLPPGLCYWIPPEYRDRGNWKKRAKVRFLKEKVCEELRPLIGVYIRKWWWLKWKLHSIHEDYEEAALEAEFVTTSVFKSGKAHAC
jgi:hypothetical protein